MQEEEKREQFSRFIEESLQQGLSRRLFLRRGFQLGLSLPSIMAVLSACGLANKPNASLSGLPTAKIAQEPTSALSPAPLELAPTVPAAPSLPSASHERYLPTIVKEPSSVRFAVIGDYGMAGEAEEAVALLVRSWEPDFIVTTGDNNYVDGLAETIDANIGQYYHMFIGDYRGSYGPGANRKRFFPSLGNHDWQGGSLQPYLDYFQLPGHGRYYSYQHDILQFFMLHSTPGEPDGINADSVQAQWLKDELARSHAHWKIVVMHHPPYSSGIHGSCDWMRWPFREWGANLVLAGHDHHYERIERDSLLYIVNGLGGAARYAPGCCPEEGSLNFFNKNHGAMLFESDGKQLVAAFITRNGDPVDSFVLERSSG